jgi:hypothetical protein
MVNAYLIMYSTGIEFPTVLDFRLQCMIQYIFCMLDMISVLIRSLSFVIYLVHPQYRHKADKFEAQEIPLRAFGDDITVSTIFHAAWALIRPSLQILRMSHSADVI